MDSDGIENKIDESELIDYSADWYRDLSMERKRAVLTEAIYKCPYLSDHMKLNKVKGSDENFTDHYTFKMMLDILRKT
jgi:hypothetical protein